MNLYARVTVANGYNIMVMVIQLCDDLINKFRRQWIGLFD